MGLDLRFDTEVCQRYVQQLAEAKALYITVQDWTLSENNKCAEIVAENSYIDYNDPSAPEKMAKANAAATRSTGLTSVNLAMGTRCLSRLEAYFNEAERRISSAEEAICRRGEQLFDL